MKKNNLSLAIRNSVSSPEWSWLILALRQDDLIWSGLQRLESNSKLLQPKPYRFGELSYSALVLDGKFPERNLSQLAIDPMQSISEEMGLSIEPTKQSWQDNPTSLKTIEQAVHLALSWREDFLNYKNWGFLKDELEKNPQFGRTALSILIGIISKPIDLLSFIISSGQREQDADLVVHAMLCQPLSADEQKTAFQQLIDQLPISLGLQVLNSLQSQRSWIVGDIADHLLKRSSEPSTLLTGPLAAEYQELSALVDKASLYQHTSQSAKSISILIDAIKIARQMQGRLSAILAQTVLEAKQDGKAEKQETDLEAWKQAVRLAPDDPAYSSGLVRSLVNEGRLADAQLQLGMWQSKDRYAQHAELLMVSSQVSFGLGDKDNALLLAQRSLEQLENGSFFGIDGYLGLKDIFLQSEKFDLLSRILKAGLKRYSTNTNLLAESAKLLYQQGQNDKSLDQIIAYNAVTMAVSKEPNELDIPEDLHQLYIKNLEALDRWDIALSKRQEIFDASVNPDSQDIYSLALCSVKAGQPQRALDLCQPILEENPEDDHALRLCGLAYHSQGDFSTAIDYLRRAVSLAPTRTDLWLELADACKSAGMEAQRLDVLKAAIQALPEDADVLFELGQVYLSRNAPTQAVIYLRRAVNLDEQPKILLRLGQTFLQLGHMHEAHELLEKAFQIVKQSQPEEDQDHEPDMLELELMHAYGRSLLSTNDREGAIVLLKKVVEFQTDAPTPYMDLSRALLHGKPTEQEAQQAIAYLKNAINLISVGSPAMVMTMNYGDTVTLEAEAMSLLAEAYAASGELQQSQAVYRQVLDGQVAQKTGWRSRLAMGFSRVAIKLEQPETALAVLKEAFQKEPQNLSLLQSLADAYLANGLYQDAYDAASKVIEQQPVELDTVNWFVNLGSQLRKHPGVIQTLVQSDMIRVLENAIHTAPSRVDLLFQLGKLFLEKGEKQPALDVFRKLTALNVDDWQVDAQELHQVGTAVREMGDASLSVILLEKAIEKTGYGADKLSTHSTDRVADIYQDLSLSYKKSQNQLAALKAVDQAIRLQPDKVSFFLQKADIFAELQKPQEMLDSIKPAIKLDPTNPAVNHRVAQALYLNGDMPGALKHAEQALSVKENNQEDSNQLETRYLAAEVSQAMLKPKQALAYLPDRLILRGDHEGVLEKISLQAELALEVGDRNMAESAAEAMRKLDAEDPRGLALQSRLVSLQGDDESARRLLQTAHQVLERRIAQKKERDGKVSVRRKPDRERSLCRAASSLRRWDLAYYWACQGVECAPSEPVSHMLKARVVVERAEEQALSNDLEVIVHAPGEEAKAENARLEFEESIKKAEQMTQQFAAFSGDETNQALNLWKARGNSVFSPDYQFATGLEDAVLSFPPTAHDVGAMLMAYRHINQPQKAIKASKAEFISTYGGKDVLEHPLVLTQSALAYRGVDQQKALDLAALASQKAEIFKSYQYARRWPEVPMTYYLQASLAYQAGLFATAIQAIQKALADWPEEPRWHALAAQIYMGSDIQQGLPNFQRAKTHLELATRLEPLNAAHFYQLGKLFFDWKDYKQAVSNLEQAGKLSPDNADTWMLLAEVHQAAGDLDQAVQDAERAMDHLADKSPALILSGKIALSANNPRLALSRAQSVLSTAPDNSQALHLMSHALEALQRPDEAFNLLDKNIPKLKDPIPTQMEKLMLLYRSKGLKVGLEALQGLVDDNTQIPEFLALLAQWLSEANQADAAVKTARAALQFDQSRLSLGQQAQLYRLIGLKMKESGQLDQAIHSLSQSVQLEPDCIDHFLNLASAYQERREHAQALKILEQAKTRFPEDYRPYYQSGIVYKDNKEYLEAEKMLRLAAKMAPGEVSIHRMLGAVVALNLVHNR